MPPDLVSLDARLSENSHSWCKDKRNFVNFQTFKENNTHLSVILLIIPKFFVLLQMHCGWKAALQDIVVNKNCIYDFDEART